MYKYNYTNIHVHNSQQIQVVWKSSRVVSAGAVWRGPLWKCPVSPGPTELALCEEDSTLHEIYSALHKDDPWYEYMYM